VLTEHGLCRFLYVVTLRSPCVDEEFALVSRSTLLSPLLPVTRADVHLDYSQVWDEKFERLFARPGASAWIVRGLLYLVMHGAIYALTGFIPFKTVASAYSQAMSTTRSC